MEQEAPLTTMRKRKERSASSPDNNSDTEQTTTPPNKRPATRKSFFLLVLIYLFYLFYHNYILIHINTFFLFLQLKLITFRSRAAGVASGGGLHGVGLGRRRGPRARPARVPRLARPYLIVFVFVFIYFCIFVYLLCRLVASGLLQHVALVGRADVMAAAIDSPSADAGERGPAAVERRAGAERAARGPARLARHRPRAPPPPHIRCVPPPHTTHNTTHAHRVRWCVCVCGRWTTHGGERRGGGAAAGQHVARRRRAARGPGPQHLLPPHSHRQVHRRRQRRQRRR
jgi:hypothetical protein